MQSTNDGTDIYDEPTFQDLKLEKVSENNQLYGQQQNRSNADNVDKYRQQTRFRFILTVFLVAAGSAVLTYFTVIYTNVKDITKMDNASACYTNTDDSSNKLNASVYYTNIEDISNGGNIRTHINVMSNSRFPQVISYCPAGWIRYKTSCYKHFPTRKIWQVARDTCLSMGTDLLSIHDLDENKFVANRFQSTVLWTGLNDLTLKGTFVWSDGSLYNFSFWRHGEPNEFWGSEDCVTVEGGSKTWNDVNCFASYDFVCKMKRTSSCGIGEWVYFNGSCYYVTHKEFEVLSWKEARHNCITRGSDLAIIHSITEHNFLMSLIAEDQLNTWWIGLYSNANIWTWTDGSQLDFQLLFNRPIRQNNSCSGISNSGYASWTDEMCSSQYGLICEKRL